MARITEKVKMREEFEVWASTHLFLQEEDTIVDDSDEYISGDMQLAWEAYQASRAALVLELPFEFASGMIRLSPPSKPQE